MQIDIELIFFYLFLLELHGIMNMLIYARLESLAYLPAIVITTAHFIVLTVLGMSSLLDATIVQNFT